MRPSVWTRRLGAFGVAALLVSGSASASPITSLNTVLGGTPLANFEGFAEGLAVAGPPGVTFGQPFIGGLPVIDNAPFLAGYVGSPNPLSANGVLTGSSPGAAINFRFAAPRSAVEIFLSDTNPQGPYAISAFAANGSLLESFMVNASLGSGLLLPGDASPHNGLFVGFARGSADIVTFGIGHGGATPVLDDAFALDDLRARAVPEPASLLLVACGLLGIARRRKRR